MWVPRFDDWAGSGTSAQRPLQHVVARLHLVQEPRGVFAEQAAVQQAGREAEIRACGDDGGVPAGSGDVVGYGGEDHGVAIGWLQPRMSHKILCRRPPSCIRPRQRIRYRQVVLGSYCHIYVGVCLEQRKA